MQQPNCYYIDVFAVRKGTLDSVMIIQDRKILASCYSRAYAKVIDILQQNNFVFDNIYFVIKQEPF